MKAKASAWQTAIGLQDVDGLKPSEYLIQTAVKHIEGDITIDQVKDLLDSYYQPKMLENTSKTRGQRKQIKFLHALPRFCPSSHSRSPQTI